MKPLDNPAVWEKGHRIYGLWQNGRRIAFVSMSPRCLGGAKVNGYDWNLETGQYGNEKTLIKAKQKCIDCLGLT